MRKTTLLNILLGLLEPNRGEVLVNGRSLRTIS
jgi:ABC-type multidrug transport system ATPase subunit